jgi:hypothetical protein
MKESECTPPPSFERRPIRLVLSRRLSFGLARRAAKGSESNPTSESDVGNGGLNDRYDFVCFSSVGSDLTSTNG